MKHLPTVAIDQVRDFCLFNGIVFDDPVYAGSYAKLPLNKSYGIDADFFVRSQSVGFSTFNEDQKLFYVLQEKIKSGVITPKIFSNSSGILSEHSLYFAGDGESSYVSNPVPFYIAGISTGNLKGKCSFDFTNTEEGRVKRANSLAILLFFQWILKFMPVIKEYALYKKLGIL
jgi:hypothetical protein